MRINANLSALNTHRQLTANQASTGRSVERLSSGLRINRAGDDAAGLAISEKMRGQIRGLSQASRNAQDGISLLQTAEGALNETHSILQRMRELAVQSANDTNTRDDRTNIQAEVNQLNSEIDRIANTTQFNTRQLIDGVMGARVNLSTANVHSNASLRISGGGAIGTTTRLDNLFDSSGNSLGIHEADTITISYVRNGATVTHNLPMDGDTAATGIQHRTIAGLDAIPAGADNSDIAVGVIAAGLPGAGSLTIAAQQTGLTNSIHALSITVTDASGNIRTEATRALSAFTQTTAAADARLQDGRANLQIGSNTGQFMSIDIGDMRSAALGVAHLGVSTQIAANQSILAIDGAIQTVSAQRSNLGAFQNRLDHTINNLGTSAENLTAAESRIRDVDMAQEMMEFTKNNILSQAAQAMLAQANQLPQGVLQLLR